MVGPLTPLPALVHGTDSELVCHAVLKRTQAGHACLQRLWGNNGRHAICIVGPRNSARARGARTRRTAAGPSVSKTTGPCRRGAT